jgi:hypothetical protein
MADRAAAFMFHRAPAFRTGTDEYDLVMIVFMSVAVSLVNPRTVFLDGLGNGIGTGKDLTPAAPRRLMA